MGSIPESGRFSGGGHGNPLQCSFMENPTDRGAWWATVHRVAKSQTRLKQLSTHACLSSGRNPTLIIWLTQKILAVFNGETIKTVVQVKLLLNPSRENPQTELNRKRVVSFASGIAGSRCSKGKLSRLFYISSVSSVWLLSQSSYTQMVERCPVTAASHTCTAFPRGNNSLPHLS